MGALGMLMSFRSFQNKEEESNAIKLIATIDKGEKWIFEGAEGAEDFGGFIDRLYYSKNHIFGTFSSCIYGGRLRIHIGFNTDMPDEVSNELLSLIENTRKKFNTFTSIWYLPRNEKLELFLYNNLPWKANGHKTHELTALREDFENIDYILPPGLSIIPFEKKYIISTCSMLDKSLAHTFENPNQGIFLNNRNNIIKEWVEKAKAGECCIMLENNDVVGAYALKGSEIDFLAVAVGKQGNGLGKQLLRHAIKHILSISDELPYLYCIDSNSNALRFYLRQAMKVTGHSGYVFLHEIDETTCY
jgi:GNAT superfamily N-acetyltransferase